MDLLVAQQSWWLSSKLHVVEPQVSSHSLVTHALEKRKAHSSDSH